MKRLLPLILLLSAPLHSQVPGVWAVRGGTVHTVSGPTIDEGIVLIRGGLIESVGASVTIPPEAVVIDATGRHVYPGLIDAHSTLLVEEPKSSGPPRDGTGMAPAETTAATRVVTLIDWSRRADVDKARAQGLTTLRISPKSRVFDGATALVNLGNGELDRNIVSPEVAQQVSFVPRTDSAYPVSLMGVIAHIRQTFLDARHQRDAVRTYESSPAGRQRPLLRDELADLEPVIAGNVPLVMSADTATMIDRALALSRELELRPIISGAVDAWSSADTIASAGVPVILTAALPAAPDKSASDEPLRLLRRRVGAPSGAMELARRGVLFAFGTHGVAPDRLLPAVRTAVRAGLPESEAIEALTLGAARVLRVDRQLGSLQPGKIANVIVTDRPLLESGMRVEQMFVDGRMIDLPRRDEDEDEDGATSGVEGSWSLRVDTSAGELNFEITISAGEGSLSGVWTGSEGGGDLASLTMTDDVLEFIISTSDSITGDTSDWHFRGTVEGDAMSGTATTVTGRYTFTGSRKP